MFDRLVDVLLQCVGFFKCAVVIDVYQRGVRLRRGINPILLEPGFHWIVPFAVDRVIEELVVPRTVRLPPQTVTLADGNTIVVEPQVTFQVRDVVKEVCEAENAEAAALNATAGVIRRHLSGARWEELLNGQSSEELETAITKAARPRGFRWGIEIMEVSFASLAKARTIRLIGSTA